MVNLATDKLLKISDVAARFGVHRRTVEGWMERGLESVLMGRLVYTSIEALERFARPRSPVHDTQNSSICRSEQRLMDDAARRHGLIE